MKSSPLTKLGYSRAEQRAMKLDFEREVKKARVAWMRGEATVTLGYSEYLELQAKAFALDQLVPQVGGALVAYTAARAPRFQRRKRRSR